jgi:hypothetical protein
MSLVIQESLPKSSVKALLDHLVEMEDPREAWRVAHPLREVPLLVVCGTVCDCDDYDAIAAWGKAHLAVLRRYRPFHHGVPSGRWLALLINRINPGLFAQVLTDWVQAPWPERPDLVAIDGKTSRLCSSRHGIGPPHASCPGRAAQPTAILCRETREGREAPRRRGVRRIGRGDGRGTGRAARADRGKQHQLLPKRQ